MQASEMLSAPGPHANAPVEMTRSQEFTHTADRAKEILSNQMSLASGSQRMSKQIAPQTSKHFKHELQQESVSIAASEWQPFGKSVRRSNGSPLDAPAPTVARSRRTLDPQARLLTKEERLQEKLHSRLMNQQIYLQRMFEGFVAENDKVNLEIMARTGQLRHQAGKWQSPFALQQAQRGRKQTQVLSKQRTQQLRYRFIDEISVQLSELPMQVLLSKQKGLRVLGEELNEKMHKLMSDIEALDSMDEKSKQDLIRRSEEELPILSVEPFGVEQVQTPGDGTRSRERGSAAPSKEESHALLSNEPLDSEARLIAQELESAGKKNEASSFLHKDISASRVIDKIAKSGASLIKLEFKVDETTPQMRRTINVKKPKRFDRVTSQGASLSPGRIFDSSSKGDMSAHNESAAGTAKQTPMRLKIPTLMHTDVPYTVDFNVLP
jgi:hypothetical protein